MTGDVKENVGNCSTCEECGFHISNEATPLLARPSSNVNYFTIILLFFGLSIGVSIGIYLLVEEIEWQSDRSFPEVQKAAVVQFVNSSRLDPPKNKIELIEIPGQPCEDDKECTKQIFHSTNVLTEFKNETFHFLIDSNATAYAHLDFDSDCTNCDNNTLVIALSGTDKEIKYSDDQKQKIEGIINYGVQNSKLAPCCVISATKENVLLAKLADEIASNIKTRYNCTT